MKVFFYVQNLLGIGHISRARRLVAALTASGAEVHVAQGGVPLPDLTFDAAHVVQLPAIKAGPGGFSDLVDAAGTPIDADFRARRTAALLDAFRTSTCDILLLEAYPFSRRQMRFELRPLIAAALETKPRPRIVTSLRDILQRATKPGREQEIVAELKSDFDLVLVHGDPGFADLGASFTEADAIAAMTRYTGLVGPSPSAPRQPAMEGRAAHDVVVSAGGGAVGLALIEAALRAKPISRLADARWLVVAGPNMPSQHWQHLQGLNALAGADLERYVADLPARLSAARLSISQAGYNTVAEILVAGCRAVLVPFAVDGETEQRTRAQVLSNARRAILLEEDALATSAMVAAIDAALDLPAPQPQTTLDGAAETVRILRELARPHRLS